LQVAQATATLMLPAINADIIDEGVAKGDTAHIITAGTVMLVVSFAQISLSILAKFLGVRTAMSLGRGLRKSVFRQVRTFSAREVAAFGVPSLITRSTNDVQQVELLVLMTATYLVATPIMAIGGIVFAVTTDLGLSGILAIAAPVILVIVIVLVARMAPQFGRMQTRTDAINRILREQLTGIRVVRAFTREAEETERFRTANGLLARSALAATRLQTAMPPSVMLVLNISSVAVLWFGAYRVNEGSLQVGALIAYLSYLAQILIAVMLASSLGFLIPRAVVSARRLGAILATTSSVANPAQPVIPAVGGAFELREAWFTFPGAPEPALRGVTMSVLPGKTTAIIGSTGSGKSTLMNVLTRQFDVTSGAVLLGGVDVRNMRPEDLWARMGVVSQHPYLFSGTVESNLRTSAAPVDAETLWAALETAEAGDFVRRLPGGLRAPVLQGGTNFSGGQRQRLSIARALVQQPAILLLDDAFSALDAATDARLRAALARDFAQAAVVVVAQRVATIQRADEIIVLDAGQVVARGTHPELLLASPEYREIVDSQREAEADT
jgi:ATP-binding cassette subfamily B protein